MKNLYLILFYFMLSATIFAQTKIIDRPDIDKKQSDHQIIHRIEFSDDYTILYCSAYHRPNYWCKIPSESVLTGESGKVYKLIRTEGMETDKEIYMPESGTMPFVMYFEALDKGESSFNLIEGEEDNSSKFYGIKTYKTESTAPVQCLIKGEVIDRPGSSRLQIVKNGGDYRVEREYIPIIEGKFEYQINTDFEEVYDIAFTDELNNGLWRSLTFFAQNGTVTMSLYPMDRHKENVIEGGDLHAKMNEHKNLKSSLLREEWKKYRNEWEVANEKDELDSPEAKNIYKMLNNTDDRNLHDSLYRELNVLRKTGGDLSPLGKIYEAKNQQLVKTENEWELEYIANNVSLVGYNIILERLMSIEHNPLGESPYIELYNNVYKKEYPDHTYTSRVGNMIKALVGVKEGGKYIDFTAPDFDGNMMTLSEQIDGKVALIDLWASWCGPCRRSSMSMIPVYEDFKDKGFTILAVARESKLSNGIHAYKKDNYPWISLVDLNDKNKIWEKYGIGNGGGGTFLVDRDGTILAVHPTAEEVREIVGRILK